MTGPEVSMDFEAVEAMANAFSESNQILIGLNKALEERIMVLEIMAFLGKPGARARLLYFDRIRTRLEAVAQKCDEMHYDLIGAIVNLRDGDSSGSQRFT